MKKAMTIVLIFLSFLCDAQRSINGLDTYPLVLEEFIVVEEADKIHLDTSVYNTDNYIFDTILYRTEYTYNENNQLLLKIEQIKKSEANVTWKVPPAPLSRAAYNLAHPKPNVFINFEKDSSVYDQNRALVEEYEFEWSTYSKKFDLIYTHLFEYNDQGLMSKQISSKRSGFGFAFVYKYDNKGRVIDYLSQERKNSDKPFYDKSRETYKYDENGNEIEYVLYEYTFNSTERELYEFDSNNHLIVQTKQKLDNGRNKFYDKAKTTFTFNDQEEIVLTEKKALNSYDDLTLVYDFKIVTEYGVDTISTTYNWDDDSKEYTPFIKLVKFAQTEQNRTVKTIQSWNEDKKVFDNYQKTTTETKKDQVIKTTEEWDAETEKYIIIERRTDEFYGKKRELMYIIEKYSEDLNMLYTNQRLINTYKSVSSKKKK